jgi:hypothetical protein
MISEDLHRWLSVRIIGWLEFDVSDSDFVEKTLDEKFQLRKT